MDSSQKKGGYITVTPSQTPWSTDMYGRGLRSADGNGNSSSKPDKDKGVNVQVILRCRPLNDDELSVHTPVVISCVEHRKEVLVVQNIANRQIDRTFTFDKVFGPTSEQKDLFDQSIAPLVNEVLEGYNCTIFAYGQTGTGKTYTMEGGVSKSTNGETVSDAGVIPRAVQQIFDILEAQRAEYSMKVTFLELYNEEISDLLDPDESKFSGDKIKKPIALMEDGKGGVFVRGLEEEVVYTAGEIYEILEKGSAKRRTAETLLNKQSSRSHLIFSITIHIKESTTEGEDLIRCGKLNLVDLAGSENILRSGATDERAREAGEINKSLLTLGRVINALFKHSAHIPFRESKLTRLLRDSLGGSTKTCIIATISPSIHCLEETLSTLNYAYRAKSIKNKPEVNKKIRKSAMIKDLYAEINRLKQEVVAAREKNGIYVPHHRYLIEEAEKKAMTAKIEKLELDLDFKDMELVRLQELYNSQQQLCADLGDKLGKTEKNLKDTDRALLDLEERYTQANFTIKERELLIVNLLKSEKALVEHAYEIRSELDNATADVSSLFSKLERKHKIEEENKTLVQKFQSQLTQYLETLDNTVSGSVMQQEAQLKELEACMRSFISTKANATEEVRTHVEKLKALYTSKVSHLGDLAGELDKSSESTFGILNLQVIMNSSSLENCFNVIALEADQLLSELQEGLCAQEDKFVRFAQLQQEGHLRAVESSRSISEVTSNLFQTLDIHAAQLTKILEESQTIQVQQLHDLEKKFEECAAKEEKILLEEVAAMLARSSDRKKKMVKAEVDSLRAAAADRTSDIQKEMATGRDFTYSVKEQYKIHMDRTEGQYIEDAAAVETVNGLQEGFRNCIEKARISSQQWRDAHNSLLLLGKDIETSVDSIIRSGMHTNQLVRSKLSSSAASYLEEVETANKDLLDSIDYSFKLDQDTCGNTESKLVRCHGELNQLKCSHYHKIMEIKDATTKCLKEEYMVDEPSCSTKRRLLNLPSMTSIEHLRSPAFEELQKSFCESKSTATKLTNDDAAKPFSGAYEPQIQSRDSRIPLIAIN